MLTPYFSILIKQFFDFQDLSYYLRTLLGLLALSSLVGAFPRS